MNLANELLLLMSALTQVGSGGRAVGLFAEAVGSLGTGFSVSHEADSRLSGPEGMEIKAAGRGFGSLRFRGDPASVSPEFPALLQNAIQMLAVILERNANEELLKDEKLHLASLVEEATASLRREEALLHETERITGSGGWRWDIPAREMYWTEGCYRIHDLDSAEFPAGSPDHIAKSLACYRPEDKALVMASFQRCSEEGLPYELELPFTTATGRSLWIRTSAQAVKEDGVVCAVVGNIVDITAEKRAEGNSRPPSRIRKSFSGNSTTARRTTCRPSVPSSTSRPTPRATRG
jgi:PAS domain-containing protein